MSQGGKGPVPVGNETKNLVNSLTKGLRVLEAFSANRPEMTLSEVAQTAELDPGTCFRMLNTLMTAGYVARVERSKRFRLTMKVTDLGFHAIARMDLREVARPILRSLVGETSEAASLGVIEGGDILYIERVRAGIARLGVDIRVGTTIPAATSAIGHAMLAFMPDDDIARVLATPPRPGDMLVRDIDDGKLKEGLMEARNQGYVVRDSPFTAGLCVLAVPVCDLDGHAVAVVSVAAPAARAPLEEFRTRLLEPVRAAARDIGRALLAGGSIRLAL